MFLLSVAFTGNPFSLLHSLLSLSLSLSLNFRLGMFLTGVSLSCLLVLCLLVSVVFSFGFGSSFGGGLLQDFLTLAMVKRRPFVCELVTLNCGAALLADERLELELSLSEDE